MTTLTSNQTVEITWTDAPIIRMTARKAIEVCGLHINEGEIFFMVRSASQENRYHCVRWNYERVCWQCSCGAGCKKHSHVKAVSAYSQKNPYSATHPQGCPKVVKVAQKFDIPVSEVEKIAAIAVEHKAAMAPKHTPMCKPIGPRDTKKDWAKEPLNGNRGFQLMR